MAKRVQFSNRQRIPGPVYDFREPDCTAITTWLRDPVRPGQFVLWIAARRGYTVTAVKVSDPAVAFEMTMRWR
jgi:hypothetical protein